MKKFSYTVIIFLIILLSVSFSYANIAEIILKQRKSVVTVYINDKDGNQIGSGTGFIIDSNGNIATNYHVISMWLKDNNNSLLVRMQNGAFFPLRELVNYDEENDIAIFKVDGKELPRVKLAKKYESKLGESIVVIGSPLGLETTVSNGIVSSIRGKSGIIQITAPVSPGSSGSPVFNSKGEVIGVATFLIEGGQNLNFAIPVKHIENLLTGTKKPKKKSIANAEPLPAVKPAPSSQVFTVVDWINKALSLWDGENFSEPEKAIEYLNMAIILKPDYAEAYDYRGTAYANFGQYQRAIQDYNLAIRLKPDYVEAYFDRGTTYGKNLGQYQRAIEDFNEAIRLRPDNAEFYNHRGLLYHILGQYQRAIEDYNKAIRLNPNDAESYTTRGVIYHILKQEQRAIEDFNEAIRLRPDFAEPYIKRGIAYLKQDNKKQGCHDAQKACDLGYCELLKGAKSNGDCH
jgi:tetratricopeptide (TPR) repeat protein